MSPEEFTAAIEKIEADRLAEYNATRAATVPHVRKPLDRSKLSRHAATSPHNRVPIGAGAATYCGAPITAEDWDRRSALAAKNAALVANPENTQPVCTACLEAARS